MAIEQLPITNSSRPRLLMLTHRTPFPPDRGDRIRSYHILKHLAAHYDISLASLSDQPITEQQQTTLRALTTQLAIQRLSPTATKLRAIRALLTGQPLTPACFQQGKLANTICKWHDEKPFDFIFTYSAAMLPYSRLLTKDNCNIRHIVDLIDVDSQKWRQYACHTHFPLRLIYQLEAKRLRPVEAGMHDRFDVLTVVSSAEADVYRRHVSKPTDFKLAAIPNGVDIEYFTAAPDPDNHNTVFTGILNYRPNVDSLIWFADNVLPYLADFIPDVTLTIVGQHPTPAIQSLANRPNIKLAGPVSDVRPYLANASVVIAPLLIARGLQNKVLEAMASQRVVICSPPAAEGIDAHHDKHFLIAGQPEQWVDQLVRVLNFPSWRRNLAANARKHIEDNYTWSRCLKPLLTLINPQHQPNTTHQSLAA